MNFFKKHKILKLLIIILFLIFLFKLVLPYIPENPAENISAIGSEIANCKREFTPKLTKGPYYGGDLFDAHFHLPLPPGSSSPFIKQAIMGKDVTINQIMCFFDKEKVRGALAFYIPRKTVRVRVLQAEEIKNYGKGRISLYISPVFLSPEELEKVLMDNPGLFVGIGEIVYYEINKFLKPLDGDWSDKVFKIAVKYNLPVMIHPGNGQAEVLEKVLQKIRIPYF